MRAFIICLLAIGFWGCNKEIVTTSNISASENSDFEVRKGILHFYSWDKLHKMNTELAKKPWNEAVIWEKSIGFESFRTQYTKLEFAEEQIIANFTPSVTFIKHSDIYDNYLKRNIISENDGSYDYKTAKSLYDAIVNTDGIFAVGDSVYQVISSGYKVVKDPYFEKIDLLKKAVMHEQYDVSIITSKPTNASAKFDYVSPTWNPNWDTFGNWRMKLGFETQVVTNGTTSTVVFKLKTRLQQRILGVWINTTKPGNMAYQWSIDDNLPMTSWISVAPWNVIGFVIPGNGDISFNAFTYQILFPSTPLSSFPGSNHYFTNASFYLSAMSNATLSGVGLATSSRIQQ